MLTEVEKLTHHFGVHVFIILHIQFCQSKLNVKIADFLLLSIRMCVCWCKWCKKQTEEMSGMTRTGCSNFGVTVT